MAIIPFNARDLLQDVAGPFEDVAVLCGAGISARAGLPVAGRFMEMLLKKAAPDDQTAADLCALLAANTEAPWLRFEGLLQVLKAYKDSDLRILNAYSGGNVQPVHRLLAVLAEKAPVMTTNFDGLIEQAVLEGGLRVTGYYSDADHASSVGPGLFKLHGTLWKLVGHSLVEVEPVAEDGPAGTLDRIATVRHSKARRNLVTSVFSRYPVVVIGYSGSDDFDICYWLRDLVDVRGILWLQFHASASQPRLLTAQQCSSDMRVEGGPQSVAAALLRKGTASRFRLVVTNEPEKMLDDPRAAGAVAEENGSSLETRPYEFGCDQVDQHLVTGALFSHLFRLQAASNQFQVALNLASDPPRRVRASVGLAEVLFYTGAEGPRQRCEELASKAAHLAETYELLEWHLRARLFAHLEDAILGKNNGPERLEAVFIEAMKAQMMDVAALAETWLVRTRRLRSGLTSTAGNTAVLLEAEFVEQHETARQAWDDASSPTELQFVTERFQLIGENRLALGAAPGACDSLNQQGVVLMRIADWPRDEWEDPDSQTVMQARKAMTRSRELARTCGLRRQEYSATMALALLDVRFEPGRRDSLSCDALSEQYADVVAADPSEKLRLRIGALLQHLGSAGVAALRELIRSFDVAGGHDGGGGLVTRLRTTAGVNARVLEAWDRDTTFHVGSAGDLSPLLGKEGAASRYWIQRLKALEHVSPPKTDNELRERVWLLLDPQPPNPPKPRDR